MSDLSVRRAVREVQRAGQTEQLVVELLADLEPNEVARIMAAVVLTRRCPRCRVPAGKRCVDLRTAAKRPTKHPHMERAGAAPTWPGECGVEGCTEPGLRVDPLGGSEEVCDEHADEYESRLLRF